MKLLVFPLFKGGKQSNWGMHCFSPDLFLCSAHFSLSTDMRSCPKPWGYFLLPVLWNGPCSRAGGEQTFLRGSSTGLSPFAPCELQEKYHLSGKVLHTYLTLKGNLRSRHIRQLHVCFSVLIRLNSVIVRCISDSSFFPTKEIIPFYQGWAKPQVERWGKEE